MGKVGLDGNLPVHDGVPTWRVYPPDFMAGTGTGYVRINFVLDKWPSSADGGWLQTYDTIVNGLKGRGIEIYGLIGHQAVSDFPGDNFLTARRTNAAQAWIDQYVESFVTIVEHFRDRVKIFESFNEPNNWPAGKTTAWIHPSWFAKMLEQIYRAVKLERGFNDVTLVSGPLLAHDIGGNQDENSMAVRYLRETYKAGKGKHQWEDVRSACGSYPLDGVGYHLYVRQDPGPGGKPAGDIQQAYESYLDAISQVVQDQDVAEKKIYVSEFGWQSVHGEDFQAGSLKAAFEYLRKDPRVALAIYFGSQDFDGEKWGLVRMDEEKKSAYNAFLEQARLDREVVGVAVEPALQEKIARLEKEAQELRQQLAASRTKVTQLEGKAQGLSQQLAASQETVTQLRRQVDTLRQELVEATTTTPVSPPPATPPAAPTVTPPVVTSPPMEDVTTQLRRHPVKRFENRALGRIQYLVIQHSVLPGDFPPGKIADYLVEKRQWPGIGYHFYIISDGTIYQTNRLETVCYFAGANVQNNPLGVCICFAGDFTDEVPTAAQLSSGGKLLAFLMQELHLSVQNIRGQKEFVATQSPGNQWDGGQRWKDMLLAEVRAAQP